MGMGFLRRAPVRQTLCALSLILSLFSMCVDADAQARQKPTPTATATPTRPPAPPPVKPTPCAAKERSGFGSVEANEGFKDLACAEARRDLQRKPPLVCDPGCIGVSRSEKVHGFTNSVMDGIVNEALNFAFGEECRITEVLKCIKK